MLTTNFPGGGGKITKEEIATALGYEPVEPDAIAGMAGVNLFGFNKEVEYRNGAVKDRSINGFYVNILEMIDDPLGNKYSRVKSMGFKGIAGYYTVSGKIRADKPVSIHIDICDSKDENQIDVTTESKIFVCSCYADNYLDAGKPGDNSFLDINLVNKESYLENKIYVEDFKVERGITTKPIYTMAPEDLAMQSDYEALAARVAALEAKS